MSTCFFGLCNGARIQYILQRPRIKLAGWSQRSSLFLCRERSQHTFSFWLECPVSYPRPLTTKGLSLESRELGLQPCLFPSELMFWTEEWHLLRVRPAGAQAFVLWTQMVCVSGNDSTPNLNEQPTLQYMLCFQSLLIVKHFSKIPLM